MPSIRRLRVTLALLLLPLAACVTDGAAQTGTASSAAPTAAAETGDPSALSHTDDWTLVTMQTNVTGSLIEFVPKGQTTKDWTKMVTLSSANLGRPAHAAKVRDLMLSQYQARCGSSLIELLEQTPPDGASAGGLVDKAVILCRGVDRTGLPAQVLVKDNSLLYLDVRASRTGVEIYQFA